jgi:hypothetical protein
LTSSAFITGLTNVLPPDSLSVTLGYNTHTLTTPFVWNGTSNVVIQTSFSNAQTATSSTRYAQMPYSAAGFVSCNYYRANSATPATILNAATPTGSYSNRPNIVLGYGLATSLIWAPITDLYSDASATIPYTGQAANIVYTKPLATITYTTVATAISTGCSASGSVVVTVLPQCETPANVNASAISVTTATISWTAPVPEPGNGYQYEVRTSGGAGTGPVGLTASGSTPNPTANITGLAVYTLYHVYVRSNCGDNVYSSWTAGYTFTTLSAPLSVTGVVTDVSCAQMNDGAIATTVTGGVGAYTYMWSNGATSASLSNLMSGAYTVTVTDDISNTASGSWTVAEPSEISGMGSPTPASCPSASDGSITANATGGTPPYTFLWSNGGTSSTISNLSPGMYYLSVNDANNCGPMLSMVPVSVTSPVCANTVVTGDITTTECYDALNTITVAGGTTTFIVEPTGHATFIAGSKIRYLEGTKVMSGGYMLGKITLTNQFCSVTKMTEVAGGKEEGPVVTERSFFNLFPNPTTGNFTLVQKGDRKYTNVKVEVYSMSGEKVLTESMIGEMKHEFRFADVSNGLYFVKVVADDYVETIKLVKVR